jgi:hypothetical protein
LNTNKDAVKLGETVYVAGLMDLHYFFTSAYVSSDKDLIFGKTNPSDIDTIVLTGNVSKACVGGPIVSKNGEIVGIMSNFSGGVGIGLKLDYLKQVDS